jgi:Fur family peroxide stress response transcriptional regulator
MDAQDRTTKYITATRDYMAVAGHATNSEILNALQEEFPDVSSTTIHRITTRMVERGELQQAPNGPGNVMRFDANLEQHDHFMCDVCGMLRDANLAEGLRPFIEKSIGNDCSISGSLTVSGICKQCHKEVV